MNAKKWIWIILVTTAFIAGLAIGARFNFFDLSGLFARNTALQRDISSIGTGQQERSSLDEREQGLNEREEGILEREGYYSDMEKDLQNATEKLQRNKWLVPAIIGAGIIVAGYAGYRIGKSLK